jgi:hypothetical protein
MWRHERICGACSKLTVDARMLYEQNESREAVYGQYPVVYRRLESAVNLRPITAGLPAVPLIRARDRTTTMSPEQLMFVLIE